MNNEDFEEFIKSILGVDGNSSALPGDLKALIENKKADRRISEEEARLQIAEAMQKLTKPKIASELTWIERCSARNKFFKSAFQLAGLSLFVWAFAIPYLTIIACIWLTKHL